ncbi:hypothetical protein V8F20_006826 [Naviculisporaceae sp. PSN 640]
MANDPNPKYIIESHGGHPVSQSPGRKHRHDKKLNLHPLFAAAHHNKTNSPLCRLPDSVLVRLMHLCDRVTVECLRRCSRSFLRLFTTAYSSPSTHEILDLHPWPSPLGDFLTAVETKSLLSLLERDAYCHGCRAARNARDWQARVTALTRTYLHCSACHTDHPACLFSASERKKMWQVRVCIGHQGYLPLCKSTRITWSMLHDAAEERFERETEEERRKLKTIDWCGSSDHVTGGPLIFTDDVQIKRIYYSRPPRVLYNYVGTPSGNSRRAMEIYIQGTHFFRADGAIKKVESLVRKWYRKQGHFICPQMSPGPLPGAALFDPGRCNCLDYPGKVESGWERPPVDWRTGPTCLTNPTQVMKWYTRCPTKQSAAWNGTVPSEKSVHCSSHLVRKPERGREGHPGQIVTWLSDGPEMLAIHAQSWFTLELDGDQRLTKIGKSWYHMLDPDSYKLTKDKEGFGVYWCKSERCKNYYRYGQSRLKPFLKADEYHHACPHKEK